MTPKPKRGRPKLDRPAKNPQRPMRLPGAVVVKAALMPGELAALDRHASATGQPSRAAAIRAWVQSIDSSVNNGGTHGTQ